jgi:hypothetical protein
VVDSVNDEIHDSLISSDIELRKVTGDTQNKTEKRLDQLGVDLKRLTIEIDPFGTERKDARERRLEKLEKESNILIREAYSEIARQNNRDLKDLAATESENIKQVLEKQIP